MSRPGPVGRLALWSSQLANERGLYLGRRSARVHVWLYRRTRGRFGGHLPGIRSARIVLVDHVGAKTGTRRTSPLICHERGDGAVVVVASKAGQPTNPAWFHNLVRNPDTTLQLGGAVRAVRARVAAADERARLWPQLAATYPGYDFFARIADREIPVVVLEPRDAAVA